MRSTTWTVRAMVGVIGTLSVVGCQSGQQTAQVGDQAFADAAAGNVRLASASGQPDNQPDNGHREMPTPTKDARFTIFCQSYGGEGHQDLARQVRDVMMAKTNYKKWYVVHGAEESTLYYGFYAAVGRTDGPDAAEGGRAMADLNAIRTLHDSRGVRLFSNSLPVPIDSPDPTANPAWDVARTGAYWSLEVGVFKDTADRKQRAVEAVAEFRAIGVPAYYYHGPHASSVCVGAWPRAAASEVGGDGLQTYDPDAVLLVTPTPVTDDYRRKLGANIQAVAPHVEPVDPDMIQMLRAYPDHFVNGSTMMKRDAAGKPTNVVLEHSALIKVPPSPKGALDRTGGGAVAGLAPTPGLAMPRPAPAGSGRLRSLADN